MGLGLGRALALVGLIELAQAGSCPRAVCVHGSLQLSKNGASAAVRGGAQLPALGIYKTLPARLERFQVERKSGEK
jgi:hypothetical protein